ncbi:MAG: glutamine-hydrolyzing carbamoyl-phosphate synthase small subunit [Pseudomonadota bacterium]
MSDRRRTTKMTENTSANAPQPWSTKPVTALLVLADGTEIEGQGLGFEGESVAEVCFNTAITGYQEILTDPSYAGQIVTFTFPHIGNVGANDEDNETFNGGADASVVGAIFKMPITPNSNYRAELELGDWLKKRGIIGMCDVDTRALTAHIRENGLANAVIAHSVDGNFDREKLRKMAADWSGIEGADLAKSVTISESREWSGTPWVWNKGYGEADKGRFHVVAMDFGVKNNILRLIADLDCEVTVVSAKTSADDILALKPDGIFLSNGPGDPAATGEYAVPTIQALLAADLPIFGICLGHQMLALALGAQTVKMHQGHHGANHPVKDHTTDKVEIVSMNHGFAVDSESLPKGVNETHVSLFDGSNCGLSVAGKPVFSVQHHPEASPGPQDSHYLFRRFVNLMRERAQKPLLEERV